MSSDAGALWNEQSSHIPSQSTSQNASPWLTGVAVGACVVGAVATRVGFFAFPFHGDSGLYAVMGRTVATGGVLYRDFYENKPPGVGLVASLFWRCFGNWWPGYVLGELLLTFAAAGLLARAATHHAGRHATAATFAATIVLLNFGWVVYTGFQLETIQACLATMAAAVALEVIDPLDTAARSAWKDALLVGLLAGCAAMVKPTGAAVAAALVGTATLQAWHGRLARASTQMPVRDARATTARLVSVLLPLLIGLALPAAIVATWVWKSGLGPEMPHLFHQIALYGSQTPVDWYIAIKFAIAFAFLGLPLLVRGWVCRHHDAVPVGQRRAMPGAVWGFIFAWFTFECLGIALQGRMYLYHFLPMAPPVALAYGLLPRSSRAPAVVLGVLPAAILSVMWEGSDLAAASRFRSPSPVGRYVLAHTAPADSLFADNMGQLLMETGRNPGSRYGLFYYWVNYDTAPQDYCHGMLADFDTRRPTYIVLDHNVNDEMHGIFHGVILGVRPLRSANAEHAWADFRSYLAVHYRLETRVGEQDLFRRLPDSPAIVRNPNDETRNPNQIRMTNAE